MKNYLYVSLYIVKKFIKKLISLRKNMRSLILWKILFLLSKYKIILKKNLYFIIWTDCCPPISSVNGDSISYFRYNAFVWYSFIFCDKKEKHTGNDSLCFSSLNLEFHVPSNSLLTKNTKDEYFKCPRVLLRLTKLDDKMTNVHFSLDGTRSILSFDCFLISWKNFPIHREFKCSLLHEYRGSTTIRINMHIQIDLISGKKVVKKRNRLFF